VLFRYLLIAAVLWVVWRALSKSKLFAPTTKRSRGSNKRQEPERLGGKLPHEILGIESGASLDTAREAYLDLVKQVHPDTAASLSPELRRLAEARTKELNRAFALFKEHNRGLGNGDPSERR
jgi:hypothetical protein